MPIVPPESRKKSFKPKVRSGCGTCKKRRIKCDETKPICLRCSTAGRVCEYTPLTTPVAVELWGTSEEREALFFFRGTVSKEMSQFFDKPFWTASILRASYDIPAAKHLLVALASSYRTLGWPGSEAKQRNLFARQQVSKSLTQLSTEKTKSILPILICCILFTVHGNLVDFIFSLPHVASGLRIVEDLACYTEGTPSAELELVKNTLTPVLRRMSHSYILIDAMSAFRQMLPKRSRPATQTPSCPPVFLSLFHAEQWNTAYRMWAIGSVQEGKTRSGYVLLDDDRMALVRLSEQFIKAVDRCIASSITKNERTSIMQAALVLKANHYGFSICMQAMNFELETDYDELEPLYWDIVKCWEDYASNTEGDWGSQSERPKIRFGTDNGLLIPLLLLSSNSRHPILRRQTISLFKSVSIYEGFADSDVGIQVAASIMEAEEEGLGDIKSASDIPESKRVRMHDASFFSYNNPDPRCRRIRLRCTTTTNPSIQTGTILKRSMWLQPRSAKPTNYTIGQKIPSYDLPEPSPTTVHGMIEEEMSKKERPDMIITATHIAWLDETSPEPGYRIMEPEHPYLEGSVLRF